MTTTPSTTRTLPTLPTAPSYSSRSPSKKDPSLKPNPHPYAIKTTSTGILTRSNSSGYNPNASHHYYIPPSPGLHRSDSKGHRATKSLNAVPESPSPSRESPRPLPIPPDIDHTVNRRDGSGGSGYVSADEVPRQAPRRAKRAETLPVFPLPVPALPAPPAEELPDNPKLWTPTQLAAYLVTALRMTSNGKPGEIESIGLPPLVAKDIATFVKSARIGGRAFLRLTEEDLEELGMNKKWRTALLAAARNLRQNVLKGRIWGGTESPVGPPSPESSSPQSAPSKIFSNADFNSSSSSIESSSSFDEEPDPNAPKGSVLLGRSKARRYRPGRVRGMVDTFERSGSFSSDGGFEDDGVAPPTNVGLGKRISVEEERSKFRTWSRQAPPPPGLRASESPSPSRGRPLPVPPTPVDHEPSMEELLAQHGHGPMTGAEAWEAVDLAAGVTVKHVPEEAQRYSPTPVYTASADTAQVGAHTLAGLGNGRGSGGSNKGKNERRIVTAIFAPTASVPDPLQTLERTQSNLEVFDHMLPPLPPSPPKSRSQSPNKRPLPVPPGQQPQAELRREGSGSSGSSADADVSEPDAEMGRVMEQTFRARLEHVEEKVFELEVREDEREAELELARVRVAEAEAEAETARATLEKGKGRALDEDLPDAYVEDNLPDHAEIKVDMAQDEEEVMEEGDSFYEDALSFEFTRSGPLPTIQEQPTGPSAGLALLVALASSSTGSSTTTVAPPHAPLAPTPTPAMAPHTTPRSVIPSIVRTLAAPATFLATSPRELVRRSKRTVRRTASGTDEYEEEGPANVSDLPAYVFLVGLGVCAVVAQVVMRKFVGKGGLRP